MDVIYSITCHESPDSFIDTLKNIFYYNRLNIAIVVHANHYMFIALQNHCMKNVYLHDKPYNKRIETHDICKAHIENFRYCRDNNIIAKYIIPLASNCYFHSFVTLDTIESLLSKREKIENPPVVFHTDWHWPVFYQNRYINSCLAKEGYLSLYGYQHEGIILEYSSINKIVDLVDKYSIWDHVEREAIFEEYFIQTIYTYESKHSLATLCKVFWNNVNYTPSIDQIKTCELPCVKRVHRSYNDHVRVWQRTITNNYST